MGKPQMKRIKLSATNTGVQQDDYWFCEKDAAAVYRIQSW
jgi:hypothetical protein